MKSPKQQQLFESDPAPWEADDAAERLVATVAFASGPPKPLDYLVPDELCAEIKVGHRVHVPLGRGNRRLLGYCTALETRQVGARPLKEIASLVEQTSLLSPGLMRLAEWISERYLCSLGQALESVLPAAVRDRAGTRLATVLSVAVDASERAAELKLSDKQQQALAYLAKSPKPLTAAQLAAAVGCTAGPITALKRKGLLRAETQRLRSVDRAEEQAPREPNLVLNADQQAALDTILAAINAGRHETILLHGITGSGKTEVYIRAVQEIVAFGRQAIVLVPEISLTPQTRQRFRARFGQVAVLHSHLSDAERHWHWERIARDEVPVVVGARSAVFAPVPRLGLIVVDEEHESSFKQDTAPRYHARDVALERARAEGVPLVLGSATPALESWRRAQQGVYRRVELPRRVLDRPLPEVRTVDLRSEMSGGLSHGALSRQLCRAMDEALKQGGQVILLLNRRGFSTHIQCSACGVVLRCPHCEIALTHHRQKEIALCHYCDYELPTPTACAACGFSGIRYSGLGTQRLEAEVRARFPGIAALRMDTDTMQAPGSHERALDSFRAGDIRILLGTQMIAKGLDFPNVTLVGVVNADTALHLPDFRAAERTFQLLVQVAGRTGRGERGGRVLVQTFSPDHAAIKAAVRHDYNTFAEQELPLRQFLSYPPFADMIRIVVRGPVEKVVCESAAHIATKLNESLARRESKARVLGPAPAPFAKLRGRHRYQLQVQGSDGPILREAVREATVDLALPDEVQWMVDVDPLDML